MLPETVATELAVPKGLPPGELHVTLAYLGKITEVDDPAEFLQVLLAAVSGVAEGHEPVEGAVSGIGRFNGTDEAEGDPFYCSLDAPGLDELRVDLVRALRDAGLKPSAEHGFTPHITIAYVPKGSAGPLPRLEEPRELSIPDLTVMYGPARVDVPLGESAAASPRTRRQDQTEDGTRDGPLTAEEIADPRTWGELYTLRTYRGGAIKAATWEEQAHPRAAAGKPGGGRFAPKERPPGEALPPDWLDRLLAGDPSFVKRRGGGKKKGKGKGAAAAKAARARVRAARASRAAAARTAKDRAELQELSQRDEFDSDTDRLNLEENQQRIAANTAIDAEPDPAKKDQLRAREKYRRATWERQQKIRHAQERSRRRAYEISRRKGRSQAQTAEQAARAQEDTSIQQAEKQGQGQLAGVP